MEFTASELWARVLAAARTSMPEQSFRTWLAASVPVGLSDTELIVEAPTDFHVEWLEDKYGGLLGDLVERTLGRRLALRFRTSRHTSLDGQDHARELEVAPPRLRGAFDLSTLRLHGGSVFSSGSP